MTVSTTKTSGRSASSSAPTRDTKRPKRVAMSGSRKRMHIAEEYKDPNFHYAWINDQGDLIARAIRAWYEHVEHKEMPDFKNADVDAASGTDSHISMNVGNGTTAYLMKQPIEAHEEDLAIGRKTNSDRLADLKRTTDGTQVGNYGKVDFT